MQTKTPMSDRWYTTTQNISKDSDHFQLPVMKKDFMEKNGIWVGLSRIMQLTQARVQIEGEGSGRWNGAREEKLVAHFWQQHLVKIEEWRQMGRERG